MSTANINSPTPPNDLRAVLDRFKLEVLAAVNCHQVGTVVKFNKTEQTVSVQLNVMRRTPAGLVLYPILADVPIFINTGGKASLRMPVAAGDTCLVLFNDRDLDNWFTTGNIVEPNTIRMHSFSDGLALVGFRSKANLIPAYADDVAEFKNDRCRVTLQNDNNIIIEVSSAGGLNGGTIGVYSSGETYMQNSLGVYIGGQAKVAIRNTSGSLANAMDLVVQALNQLNIAKTGGSAATQILNAQLALNALLT